MTLDGKFDGNKTFLLIAHKNGYFFPHIAEFHVDYSFETVTKKADGSKSSYGVSLLFSEPCSSLDGPTLKHIFGHESCVPYKWGETPGSRYELLIEHYQAPPMAYWNRDDIDPRMFPALDLFNDFPGSRPVHYYDGETV